MSDETPELPSDQDLAEYLRYARDAEDPETWVEYFGLKDADARTRRKLDDRMRQFWIDRGL